MQSRGGAPPYSIVPLQEGERPDQAIERVKELLGLAGLYGDEYNSKAMKTLANEILCAILVAQVPAKGACPFYLLKARPQRTNGKSDFQSTIITMMEKTFKRQFLGPAADGADAKLISSLIREFLNGTLNFIAQQGINIL